MTKRKLSYNDYRKYLDNSMTVSERHDFERLMMQDAFDEDAFDGFQQTSDQQASRTIEQLKERIGQIGQPKKRITPYWLRYAAVAIIVLGLGISSIWYFNSNAKYDLEYGLSQESSFAVVDTIGMHMHEKVSVQEEVEPVSSVIVQKNEETVFEKSVMPATAEEHLSEVLEEENDEVVVEEIEIAFDMVENDAEIASEEYSAEKPVNVASTVSESPMESLSGSSQPSKKMMNKESVTTRSKAQSETAPKIVNHIAMPPRGIDHAQFQKKLTDEIALILTKYEEQISLLTLTVIIDDKGDVLQVKQKEQLKRKTMREIEKLVKELGTWQPAFINGAPKESEQIIILRWSTLEIK